MALFRHGSRGWCSTSQWSRLCLESLKTFVGIHPAEANQQADLLSKIASTEFHSLNGQVILEVLECPSTDLKFAATTSQPLQVES